LVVNIGSNCLIEGSSLASVDLHALLNLGFIS
jgi:hypothetical protein